MRAQCRRYKIQREVEQFQVGRYPYVKHPILHTILLDLPHNNGFSFSLLSSLHLSFSCGSGEELYHLSLKREPRGITSKRDLLKAVPSNSFPKRRKEKDPAKLELKRKKEQAGLRIKASKLRLIEEKKNSSESLSSSLSSPSPLSSSSVASTPSLSKSQSLSSSFLGDECTSSQSPEYVEVGEDHGSVMHRLSRLGMMGICSPVFLTRLF